MKLLMTKQAAAGVDSQAINMEKVFKGSEKLKDMATNLKEKINVFITEDKEGLQ